MAILVSVPIGLSFPRALCHIVTVPSLFQILLAHKRGRGDVLPRKLKEPDIGSSTMTLNLTYTSHPPLLGCTCCGSAETPPWPWPFIFINAASSILLDTYLHKLSVSFFLLPIQLSSFSKDQLKICSTTQTSTFHPVLHFVTKSISHPSLPPFSQTGEWDWTWIKTRIKLVHCIFF